MTSTFKSSLKTIAMAGLCLGLGLVTSLAVTPPAFAAQATKLLAAPMTGAQLGLASLSTETTGKPKADILHCPSACTGVAQASVTQTAILASLATETTGKPKADILHCPSACTGVAQASVTQTAILASLSTETTGKPKADILHCPSACTGVAQASVTQTAILASLSTETTGKPKADILHCPSACTGVAQASVTQTAILASLPVAGSRNLGWKCDHNRPARISAIHVELV
jgi:hypothetical protein